ncbi:helix-turn-helix domain-containing protein [Jiangella anatolica]|uniref:helix-turn-helix domain-containing protein n=1 Tax=Jiangella anatolica TaxID=2670374 RepID=UPI001313EDDA|nr:helix-turn-helix domain-containing protein [Jiangella anatolica]
MDDRAHPLGVEVFRSTRELGAAVRDRRNERELTQAELARRAGVSREWVNALERGKPNVNVTQLMDVLEVLDLALDLTPLTRDTRADEIIDELFGREPDDHS